MECFVLREILLWDGHDCLCFPLGWKFIAIDEVYFGAFADEKVCLLCFFVIAFTTNQKG